MADGTEKPIRDVWIGNLVMGRDGQPNRVTGIERPVLGEFWERAGRLSRGRVGDAYCRLFPIREYVDTLLHEVTNNPDPYFS